MKARWIDCSIDEYHADTISKVPSLSASIAHTLVSKSPLHAWTQHPKLGNIQEEPTKYFDMGSVVHELVLGKGKGYVAIPAPDYRTKIVQELRDAIRLEGKTPILQYQLEEALTMAGTLVTNLKRDHGIELIGESEKALVWDEETDEGEKVRCKLRFDHVMELNARLYDLKTTVSAHPDIVAASMIRYGYDIAEAAYTSGFLSLHPELAGREEFTFIFCELTPPYACTPIRSKGTMKELGLRKWRRAVNTWAECLKTGKWPAYSKGPVYVDAPAWALRNEEDFI